MKQLICILLVIVISGCGFSNWSRENDITGNQKQSIRIIDHINKEIKMEVLDEIPSLGIIVIRFIDGGHTRYIAIRNQDISVILTTQTGSSKHPQYEDDSITTVR
jgi:hypothetical protein